MLRFQKEKTSKMFLMQTLLHIDTIPDSCIKILIGDFNVKMGLLLDQMAYMSSNDN